MNSALIFGGLIALMLTGMPISIALGLTVLSFLYVMTQVPIEAVALKLFTGIESFEIMAIPFFILAGNFLTHGGVARRFLVVPHHNLGAHRRQGQRRRQAVLAQPHHGEALSNEQIGREGLHRIFNVARPTRARIIEIIQNLITIVGSAQPFFSK